MNHHTKLMNRDYVLLWLGQTASLLGIQAFSVAVIFWVKHATNSATIMGLLQMTSSLPGLVLSPIGGTLADRYSRRDIIVLSDVLRSLAIFSLTALVLAMPGAQTAILSWILVVGLCLSAITAFFDPTISAFVPDLVPRERINGANAMVQLSFQLSVFAGQGFGGILFRLLGAPMLFLLNGATYLFAAIMGYFISTPGAMLEGQGGRRGQFAGFRQELVEGFRFIWGKAGLRQLVFASAFLVFFTTPIINLLPFYVEDVLGVDADWYGFLLAAYGIGSLAGYLIAGTVRLSHRTRASWMIGFFILESAGYGVLGLVRAPVTALVFAVLGGIAGGFVGINVTTAMQVTTPSRVRGRVFGLLATLSGGLYPVAAGLSGVLTDLLNRNVPLIYMSCGIIMMVLTCIISLDREFRQFLAYEQEKEGVPGRAGSEPSQVTSS